MHILMDYYLIIIKLGVMTWKDVYDAVLNTFFKKEYHTEYNSIFSFFFFQKGKKWKIMTENEGRKNERRFWACRYKNTHFIYRKTLEDYTTINY